MNWSYTFAKKITLTDYYKRYLHYTSYTSTTSSKKGYVVDSDDTFFKRNTTSNNLISESLNYSNGTASRYTYGSKYTLVSPTLTVNNNTYTQCTIKVTNANAVACTYYDRDVNSAGYVDIPANSSITYDYAWTKSQYTSESHTFSGYLTAYQCNDSSTSTATVYKPTDVKPTLAAPSISISDNNNYSYKVTYTNNANTAATIYTYNGNFSLGANGSKTFTNRWDSTSINLYAYASASGYTDSSTTKELVIRPSLIKPTAPSLDIKTNTYSSVIFLVTNPNSVAFDVYDTGGNLLISQLSAYSTQEIGYNYTGSSKTLSCYFMGDSTTYSDSSLASLTAVRPDAPVTTLDSPAITYTKGTTSLTKTKYIIKVYNSNSVSVNYSFSGDDLSNSGTIAAGSTVTVGSVDILAVEARSYTCTFTATGYKSSSQTIVIPVG